MTKYNELLNNFNEDNGKSGTKDFLLGAIVGGIVGAATALWLSPKSRTDICEAVNNKTANLREKADTLQEKVSDLAQITKNKTSSFTSTISNQSSELFSKIKGNNPKSDEENFLSNSVDPEVDPIQKMLEETKKAFDETEIKFNH